MTHSAADGLAALRDGRFTDPKSHYRVKLDTGISLEAPAPALLADVFAGPYFRAELDLFRSSAAILIRPKGSTDRPTPVPLADLVGALRRALLALPDRTDAGRPYTDARILVRDGEPGTVDEYLASTVRAVRRTANVYKAPARPRTSRDRPARTGTERSRECRDRARAAETASVRWWLEHYITGWDGDLEPPAPGTAVPAAALLADCLSSLDESADLAEPVAGDGTVARVPRRRVFYDVADDVLGPRQRAGKSRTAVYVIPYR